MSPDSAKHDYQDLMRQTLIKLDDLQSKVKEAEYARTEPIAIIGLGCRFPGGANHPDAYWDLLRNGVDATCEVPADRWDKDAYYDPDPDAPGKIYTRRGGFIDRIDTFDPPFFRIAAREAESMDPQQRLLLEVGWEALEYANIPAERLYNTPVGVFVGISRFDYAMYQMGSGDPRHITGLTGTGSAMCVAAGRLSFCLGVTGPSLIVDTACSSSLVALHLACESLRRQECQMALAGGVNLQIRPEIFVNMSRARMLSPDGHCKTFAATADGIALGEGAGMLALKRLSDAQQDGDRILALIRGSMVNQDGPSGGLTVPNGPSQERVIRQALHNAGVEPDAVSYIEAHGTGTPLGDPIEIGALGQVFGPRPMERPLFVGSVKTNLGHLEAAAGISGIIKLVLCFLNEYLPPHLHCEQPNPRIAWDRWPFLKLTHEGVSWKQGDQPRIAGISGFGVSGTNAHIVLQEPPQSPTRLPANAATAPERPLNLLTLSAKSEDALQALTGRYIDHLENASALSAGDLCFTANTGRSVFPQRLCVMAEDTDGLRVGLADFVAGRSNASVFNSVVKRERAPRLAFLFTGQGSQYVGMGRQLYDTEPVFREAIERCAAILDSRLAQPLLQVLYPPEGIESPIDDTAFTQPVIFAIEYALATLWGSWGLTPDIVLGHSVGDYAAACIAGVFTLEEGLHLIAERGRLMGALPRDGAMISVFAEASRVSEAIEPYANQISLAAINAPDRVVVSGARDTLSHALSELQAQGVETRDLQVSHAFHSPLLEPMLANFEAFARRIPFRTPTLPLVCNLTGRRLPSGAIPDATYWRRHCREPVQFASSLEAVLEDSNVVCLEVGPQPVLTSLGQRCTTQPLVWLASLRRGRDDWQVLFRSLCDWYLQGGQVDWAGLDKHHPRQRLLLPFYPFQRKRYWLSNPHLPDPGRHEPPPSVQPDDHDITAPPTAPPVSVADAAATVPDVPKAQARKEQVRETLSEFISNIVGIDPVEIGDRVPFLEMGLDSILLLDAIRVIKERFAVEIKIRQFFEDIPDLVSLIDYIAAHAAPEPIPVQPTSTEDGTIANPVADAVSTTEQAAMPVAADATVMERVINAQLQFMSQQLTALGDAIAKAAPQTGAVANASTNGLPEPPPRQQSEVAVKAAPPTPPAETADPTTPAAAENRSSPLRALNASPQARHGFSARQEQHLQELTTRYTRKTPKSKELAQASRGVLADSRAAFGFRFSTKELLYPITSEQALGSRLTDIDGNTYVDLTMGFGVLLFGNHPQFVTDAVAKEMQRGIQLGPRSDLMQQVANLFTEMTGTERVAFNNSGTEAVMTAVRLARTKTERTRIAIFEGAYHGHADGTLIGGRVQAGQVRSYPMAPGVPQSMADNAIVLEYGAPASLAFLRDHAHDLAAVLVEPVQSRRPGIRPIDFLHDLRRLTAASGTALIFDEMITGFRVHPGGLRHLWGIEADMTTYGKIVGGGLPIGAIAGSREYLDTIDGGMWQYGDRSYPAAEKTYFAGTFSQHPFVMATALAVLEHLQAEGPALQERLNQRTARLVETLNTWFQDEQLPIHVDSFSSWFLFKSEVDLELFYYHMLVQGVYICEGRSCFLSTAHTEDDLDTVVRAVKNSVNAMRDGGFLPARTKLGAARATLAAEPIEIPLSRAQQQLSILVDLEPEGSLAYHDPTCLRLTGPLRPDLMLRALEAVAARHEALRTVIASEAEVQRVLPEVPVTLPLLDISAQNAAARELATASWLDDVCNRPLDPIAGPVFRAALLKLSENEHLMAFNVHHILVDGWSVGVILRDLGQFYSAYCRGETYHPEPSMPYRNWLRWQKTAEYDDTITAHEAWWLAQFRQPVSPPLWPSAAPRPALKTWNGGRRSLCLDDRLVRTVREYALKRACTVFMTYFAVYATWLHRLTGQDDLVIGTPTAGRDLDGANDMVGYCAHLLPIRTSCSKDMLFSAFLQSVKSALLDAYEHEMYPFSRLIDKLNVRQDPSHSLLVDIVFNFEVPSAPTLHELALESVDCPIRYTAFDLTFSIMERGGQTILDCDYNTDLFDAQTVDRFLAQFHVLLARITDAELPDPLFSSLPPLNTSEKQHVPVVRKREQVLPVPHRSGQETNDTAPRSPVETQLAEIWAEVLNVPSVGIGANFFDELGGHSILGARILSKVRERFGVALPFRTLFEFATIRDFAAKIEAVQTVANTITKTPERIPRLSGEAVPLLSLAQQRLWFLDRLTGPSAVYNMPFAIRLEGTLDVPALEHALIAIAIRHDSFRTAITEVDGESVQLIHATPHVTLPLIALDGTPGETQATELERLLAAEAQRPFDLSQAPLLRTTLVRLSEHVYVLMVTMHHIISDGWSISVFIRELATLYNARINDTIAVLPALPIRYADYAHWQRQYMQGELLAQRLAFWKAHLHGAPTLLELPTDRPRPPIQTYRGRVEHFPLDAEFTHRLHALGKDTGATLFMTLLAGYATLLCRYAGSDDIMIGSVFANRDRSEIESLIGFFVNTLPLRVRLSDNPTTRELTAAVRQICLDAHAHQDLPFERLVDELEPERNLSHSPLFQVVFALQNLPATELELEALTCTEIKSDAAAAKWDLNLSMEERDGVLIGEWEYNTDLFDPPTISRMIGHFRTLLANMCATPDQPVSGLSILTELEHQQLAAWNATAKHYGQPKPLHRLFEEQVTATPDRIALVFQDTTLTYASLNRRANRLASLLRQKGIGPDVPVALYMERSLELVVGLFGVLKAGGAYLPLDPEYPRERLAFMMQDAAAPVILTQQYLKDELPEHQAEVLCLDTFAFDTEAIDTVNEYDPQVAVTDSHAAYIIYTSGSTGMPKGAINTHSAIRNRLLWMQEAYRLDETDRVLQKTPYSFDVSVWEFFWPLITGACLVVADPGGHRDSAYLVHLLREQHVTVLHFVPSMLEVFLEEPALDDTPLPNLRKVICSGEALTGRHRDRFFEQLPGAELHNLYGPTEAAIDVTYRACAPEDEQVQVPIGRPIANMRMHLLDQHLQPVPVGISGELHIAGVGLARGYLRRPELTAEKFIPDPFAQQVGERLYKTGDRVRYLPNGDIDFLGRIDYQVKIRGFRIELGEIEAALETVPGIDRAVVMAQEDGGTLRLVAYLVTADWEAVEAQNPRGHIAQTLPYYMVPSSFVYLDTLPLSPNGKIDRRALPAPGPLGKPQSYAPPTTPEEAILAEIWGHVLGVPRVGIDDSFFELGGDSILSLKILAQATRAGLSMSLQDLFRHGTVRELARIAATGQTTGVTLPPTEPFGLLSDKQRATLPTDVVDAYPLTHLQAGMLFHADLHPETAIYHDVFSYLLQAPLDIEYLQGCLQHVVDRHPVLRTGFLTGITVESLQVIYHQASIELPVEDLSHLLPADRQAVVEAWINAEKQRPFIYTQPPLLRAQVHRCSAETFYLTLSFHHCILDGWSVVSLLAELFHDYFRRLKPSLAPLEPLPEVSFRDFVALERHALGVAEQRRFWAEQLEGFTVTTIPRWPLGARLHEPIPAEVGEHQVTLDADISDGLKTLAAQAGVPIKSVLLAAHCCVLAQLCNQSDIVTGITINGRPEQAGSEHILGLFLNTLPLRLACLSGTWLDLVQDAWKAEQELWPRRHFPLFELQHMMGGQPLFETCFNFTHFHIYQEVHEQTGLEVLDYLGFEKTNFTLTANFGLSHDASEVTLTLSYDPQELIGAQVGDIASYYTKVLNAIATQPEARYETHALLSPAEKHKLLVDVNSTAHPALSFSTFIDAFEARVAEHPDRQAVVAGEAILTYGALNRRANQLAHYLQRLGAGPEVPVGVCMNRTPDLMVALLAVLKAGAAFVPMDPVNPQARLAFMLRDAQVPVLLTRSETVATLPVTQARTVQLDADWEIISREDVTSPARQLSSQHLAYVIYTSGSTGTPKGTLLTHGGLANYLDWCRRQYESCTEDGHGAPVHGSIGFDATLTSLLSPLNVGRAVFLIPEQNELEELAQVLFSPHHFSLVKLTPAHLEVLGQGFNRQRIEQSPGCLVIGGEALHEESLAPWRASFPHTRIYNEYGPTESVVGCCVYDASAPSPLATAVPIGQPSSNIRLYITGAFLQLVPTGTPGELMIGGAQLARGYLGRPALTAERFIPDPLSGEPGTRLYRTGDATRYLPGERTIIEFLGRMDHQVKIRGYRIELGEIEAVLKQHPQVSEAAVLVRKNSSGDQRLAAYVQGMQGETLKSQVLHDFLQERLPDYMVPSVFSYLDAFPLTANGKLDRRALPAPDWTDQLVSFVAPRTQTETLLADIWAQVLGMQRSGIDDDFFECGGHSLLATQLISRIRDAFALDLPLQLLFDAPTPRAFAERVDRAERNTTRPLIRPVSKDEPPPLSFAQQRLWLVEQLRGPSPAYNIPAMIRFEGHLETDVLEQAFQEIVRRHEVLRTNFADLGHGPVQVITPEVRCPMPLLSLEHLPEDQREPEVRRLAAEEAERPFDLAHDPLLRLHLLRLAPASHVLPITVHHIVADGWSIGIFLQELGVLYEAFMQDKPSPLAELSIQYADFARCQREWLDEHVLAAQLDYWREQLRDLPERCEFPPDRPRPQGNTASRASFNHFEFGPTLLADLQALNRREHVTLFMTLLAAFDVVLWYHTGLEDIAVGTDIANRNHSELEGLIGFFVNQLVLRTQLGDNLTFGDLLQQVKAMTLASHAHQDLPFDELVRHLAPDWDLAHTPFFQIKLVLQNASSEAITLPGLETKIVDSVATESKFDLIMNIAETEAGLIGIMDYNRDLYLDATMRRLWRNYEFVLRQVVNHPESRLALLRHDLAAFDQAQQQEHEHSARNKNLQALQGLRSKRNRR